MIIKILGTDICKSCLSLEKNVRKVADDLQLDAEIIKITDFEEMQKYDIIAPPGLVINEKLVSFGKVLKEKDIIKLFSFD